MADDYSMQDKDNTEACVVWGFESKSEVREGNRCDVGWLQQPATSSDFELSPSHADLCTGSKATLLMW